MQCVLPLPEVCTPPGDNPLCGTTPPISAAQIPWECAPPACVSPASRNPGDASHSVCPQNQGDRRSGPQHHNAERQSHEGCSDRADTPDVLHPASSQAGPITTQCGGGNMDRGPMRNNKLNNTSEKKQSKKKSFMGKKSISLPPSQPLNYYYE